MTTVMERRLTETVEPPEPVDPPEPEYTIGRMTILHDPVPIEWDTRDEASVARAEAAFAQASTGNLAYKTGASGSEVIREFDPAAEQILIARQLQGG